jgi:hypothetical protein
MASRLVKPRFKLNPRDCSPLSYLNWYRLAIVRQLKKNGKFFLDLFLEFQRLHMEFRDSWNDLFIHATVEIAGKGSDDTSGRGAPQNGVGVRHVCVRFFDINKQLRAVPDTSKIAQAQINLLNGWKKAHPCYVTIGFTFDFEVYFPQKMICFGVGMMFKLKKRQFDSLLRQSNPLSQPDSTPSWRYKLADALSDFDRTASEEGAPRPECVLDPFIENILERSI